MKALILTCCSALLAVVVTMLVMDGKLGRKENPGVTQVNPHQQYLGSPVTAKARSSVNRATEMLWDRAAGESLEDYRARLIQGGVPPEIIADVLRGMAERELKDKINQLKISGVETNWMPYREFLARKHQAAQLMSDKARLDVELGLVPKRFVFLSSEQYKLSLNIENTSTQRREEIIASVADPAERAARLREARLSKVSALRAAMSEGEYLTYALTTEPMVTAYARTLSFFEPTEDEFKKLIALRERHLDAFDMSPDALAKPGAVRVAEQSPFKEELRQLLGEDRYKAYVENTDSYARGAYKVAADSGLSPQHGKWLLATDRAFSQAVGQVADAEPERKAALIVQFQEALRKEIGDKGIELYNEHMGSWLRVEKNRTWMAARAQGKPLPPGFSRN